MNDHDVRTLLDNLETARINAGAEFERLCNNKQYIDACIFQSLRNGIAHNIQLLQSYVIAKKEKTMTNHELDKIRAEIEDAAFDSQEIDGEHESIMFVYLNDVLEIIDKHKADKENK